MSYTATLTGSGWLVDPIINPKSGVPAPGFAASLTGSGWVVQPIPKPTEAISAFDPANKSAAVTLSENNALMTSSENDKGVKSVKSNSAGRRYFEVQMGAPGIQGGIGIASTVESVDTWVGSGTESIGLDTDSGDVYMTSGPKGAAGLGVVAASDVIGVAVDLTLAKIWFSKNGTFGSGQNPVTNTGGVPYSGNLTLVMVSANAGGAFRLRTLASQFTSATPSGFTAWGA